MLKDTEMISHYFDDEIVIYPIADVHYGSIYHNEKAWEAICNEVLDRPNAYIVLNGDLINNNTKSAVGSCFEDIRPMEQKRRMVEMLKPLSDRILCITSGNHERRSLKDADDDVTYDIASKLDLEHLYRPNIAFLKIGIGARNDNCGKAQHTYSIAVTHGSGGGIYTGATVNRNERFGNVIDGLDCLVVGHTHKGTVTRPGKLVIDSGNDRVVQRDYVVISCVSWMCYGGYAAQKMLLPAAHGQPQKLLLKNNKFRAEPKRIEVIW